MVFESKGREFKLARTFRRVLAGSVVAFALFSAHYAISTRIQVSTYQILSQRLPQSFEGFRIVQISDLHGSSYGNGNVHLLQAIRACKPDLIAVTGDLVELETWQDDQVFELTRNLKNIAPVFVCLGNHEAGFGEVPRLKQLVGVLESGGARVLRGKNDMLIRGGDSIGISGIDDPEFFSDENEPKPRIVMMKEWNAALAQLKRSTDPERFSILLSHRPELLSTYADLGFDLVFAGHAHGGEIKLPFIGPLYAPDQGWFPKLTEGVHSDRNTQMVVSRGLSRSFCRIRFRNRPEIVIAVLQRQPSLLRE